MTAPGQISGPRLARGEPEGPSIRGRSSDAPSMLEFDAASAGTCDTIPGEWSLPAGQGPECPLRTC